jgi:DNA helicase-2/ATP-dependent DNA helicase PcrA
MLNKQQKNLVEAPKGTLLCIAGAGSGKTKCIIEKIRYAIKNQNIQPEEILALTFTKKAATEMQERLSNLLGKKSVSNLIVSTINSFCYRHVVLDDLRYFGFYTNRRPQILTDGYKPILKALFPKESSLQFVIKAAKKIDSYLTKAVELPEDDYVSLGGKDYNYKELLTLIRKYQFTNHVITFTDQIVFAYQRLERDIAFRHKLATKFKLIIVDEAQDNNLMQSKIVLYLSEIHKNIVCVGDDAQSIYQFRGADPDFFLGLHTEHKFKLYSLTVNYRSVQPILDLGNMVLKHNFEANVQIPKLLEANRKSDTAKLPAFFIFNDYIYEMRYITTAIKKYVDCGGEYRDIAILCRSVLGGLGRPLQATLRSMGIPYHVVGGHDITQNIHVKRMFSVFALACGYEYVEDWIEIFMIFPGIGPARAKKLADSRDNIPDAFKEQYRSILDIIEKVSKLKNKPVECYHAFRHWYLTTVDQYLVNVDEDDLSYADKMLNIVGCALHGKDLELAIENIKMDESKEDETDLEKNAVIISTIHRSKGLEWPFVIIPDCHTEMIPHPNCTEKPQIYEECRILHVGVTRAKDFLVLSASLGGNKQISPFLLEAIDNGLLKIDDFRFY